GVVRVLVGDEPGVRLAPHLPPPPATIDDAQYVEQRRATRFPAISEKEGYLAHAGNDLGDQLGGLLRRAWADVDPEQKPTPHRQGGMDPGHLTWTQFGMGFVQLDAGHIDLAHHLVMVSLSALGRDVLEAIPRFEIYGTNAGGPPTTNTPPLTFHQP